MEHVTVCAVPSVVNAGVESRRPFREVASSRIDNTVCVAPAGVFGESWRWYTYEVERGFFRRDRGGCCDRTKLLQGEREREKGSSSLSQPELA